jgi:hypothetical protein
MPGMSRRRFHDNFAVLALVAMLLLVALPTAGRITGAPTHAGHAIGASAHPLQRANAPMVVGGVHRGHGMHHAALERSPVPTQSPPRSGHDCDYCPLLTGLAPPALPLAIPSPRDTGRAELPARRSAPIPTVLVPGLGARGPPSLRV